MSKDYPTLTLNDDRQIPQLGFGTWQIEEDKAADAVSTALETGYWLIDTAAIYKNEKGSATGPTSSSRPRSGMKARVTTAR